MWEKNDDPGFLLHVMMRVLFFSFIFAIAYLRDFSWLGVALAAVFAFAVIITRHLVKSFKARAADTSTAPTLPRD